MSLAAAPEFRICFATGLNAFLYPVLRPALSALSVCTKQPMTVLYVAAMGLARDVEQLPRL
jgi:hypothetical protein